MRYFQQMASDPHPDAVFEVTRTHALSVVRASYGQDTTKLDEADAQGGGQISVAFPAGTIFVKE